MSSETDVSVETLNAFVDEELEAAERERVFAALERDPELRRQVCELRNLKEALRHAYAAPPRSRQTVRGPRAPAWARTALAAAVLMSLSAALGWYGHAWRQDASAAPHARIEPGSKPLAALESGRVVLHITTADAASAELALDEAQDLLAAARSAGRQAQVEIVANSLGLNVLRADVSAHGARIAALLAEYPNLSFIACGQTMERLRQRGIEVRLLPGVTTAPSALDEIVTRMREGWFYIRA